VGGVGGATGGVGGATGGVGGASGGAGGSLGGAGGAVGGSGGVGGATGGVGGALAGTGGVGGAGGSAGAGLDTAEKPEACVLVTSCPTCCTTAGVYALDVLSEDRTAQYVTNWAYSDTGLQANFTFTSLDEVGGIFFKLGALTDIGSLGVSAAQTGGTLEVALVREAGAHGCIYPIVGDALSPTPDVCWGDGAGPYLATPVDQIDVRVHATASGPAVLLVGEVVYGP
jgi:hypothetical protein